MQRLEIGKLWQRNQQMHINVDEYIIQRLYLLHVSATPVALRRKVH